MGSSIIEFRIGKSFVMSRFPRKVGNAASLPEALATQAYMVKLHLVDVTVLSDS